MTQEERDALYDVVWDGTKGEKPFVQPSRYLVVDDGEMQGLNPKSWSEEDDVFGHTVKWYKRVIHEGRDPTIKRPHSLKLLEKARRFLDRYDIDYRREEQFQEQRKAKIDEILRKTGVL
jgi:hypothetical protein